MSKLRKYLFPSPEEKHAVPNIGKLLLLFSVVVGFLFFKDFGASWDEPEYYEYAMNTLRAYSLKDRINGDFNLDSTLAPTDLRYYGPAYLTFWGQPVNSILKVVYPQTVRLDLWHLVNYLFYVFSAWLFYKLAIMFASIKASLVATILYWTQPILFGSAWINPKDIPFMVLFLGTIYFGITALKGLEGMKLLASPPSADAVEKKSIPSLWLLVLFIVLFLIVCFSFLFSSQIESILIHQIGNIYQLDGQSFIRRLFDQAAAFATPETIDRYSAKAIKLFHRSRMFALVLSGVLIAWGFVTRRFPGIWMRWFEASKRFSQSFQQAYIKENHGKYFISLILAIVFLGSAASVRIIGPMAGFLVVLFGIIRYQWKSLPLLVAFGITGFAVMVFSWPYLWYDPINRLLFVLSRNSEFPTIYNIFFNGIVYKSNQLPFSYLPTLLGITLTEVSLPLFIIGVVVWANDLRKKNDFLLESGLFLLWFLIPFFYVLIYQPPLYDSYRHFYFILPPIFLIGSYGLDFLLKNIRHGLWQAVFISILLLPALIGIIRLHPYQYAYYNAFVGGTKNAAERYEVDYWLTCYRELTRQVMLAELPSQNIYVAFSPELVAPYVKESYTVSRLDNIHFPDGGVIFLPRRWEYLKLYPQYQDDYIVDVDGLVLCVAKTVTSYNEDR